MSKIVNHDAQSTIDLLAVKTFVSSATNKRLSNIVNVSKIIITNKSASVATISLYIRLDASPNTEYYLIKNLDIPAEVTWVWDEEFNFNNATHALKLQQHTDTDLTIIIK